MYITIHMERPFTDWDKRLRAAYDAGSPFPSWKIFQISDYTTARAASPGLAVVYRRESDKDNQGNWIERAGQSEAEADRAADEFIGLFKDSVNAATNGQPIYVESLNEDYPTNDVPRLQSMVAFDRAFVRRLPVHIPGALPVVVCAAVGNPDHPEFVYLVDLARETAEAGGAFGYHAYTGVYEGIDWIDSEQHQIDLHLRWNQMDQYFLVNHGIRLKWFLGEGGPILCGPDGYGPVPYPGWLDPQVYGGSLPAYMDHVSRLDQALAATQAAKEGRLLGLALFTRPGDGVWGTFDVPDEEVANYMIANPTPEAEPVEELCPAVADPVREFIMLVPTDLTTSEQETLMDWTLNGIPGHTQEIGAKFHAFSFAPSTAMRIVLNGKPSSILYVVDGDRIGTGLDEEWVAANCPKILSERSVVFLQLREETPPVTFSFKVYPLPDSERVKTQAWGARPDVYDDFGLPGHEGNDLRATTGDRVVAVADGTVDVADTDEAGSNYGLHVRVGHVDGYQTIYAHLSQVLVSAGQAVKAGDILGLAGSSGFSDGPHLHLGLKRFGFTYTDGFGTWPFNFHDPTPFIAPFLAVPTVTAYVGLHASADPGGAEPGGEPGDLGEVEYSEFEKLRGGVVKVMSAHSEQAIATLAARLPATKKWIIRAFLDFGGRVITPQQFVNDTWNDSIRAINTLADRGVAYEDMVLEVHNEPNLVPEGFGASWDSGATFAVWFTAVVQELKNRGLPAAVGIMFPGLSPGGDVAGLRRNASVFLTEAAPAMSSATDVGVHCYWTDADPMSNALAWLDAHRTFNLPLWITEASLKQPASASRVAQDYYSFLQAASLRSLFRGVTFYVASGTNPAYKDERWITYPEWKSRGIAAALRTLLDAAN